MNRFDSNLEKAQCFLIAGIRFAMYQWSLDEMKDEVANVVSR